MGYIFGRYWVCCDEPLRISISRTVSDLLVRGLSGPGIRDWRIVNALQLD